MNLKDVLLFTLMGIIPFSLASPVQYPSVPNDGKNRGPDDIPPLNRGYQHVPPGNDDHNQDGVPPLQPLNDDGQQQPRWDWSPTSSPPTWGWASSSSSPPSWGWASTSSPPSWSWATTKIVPWNWTPQQNRYPNNNGIGNSHIGNEYPPNSGNNGWQIPINQNQDILDQRPISGRRVVGIPFSGTIILSLDGSNLPVLLNQYAASNPSPLPPYLL